MNRTKKWASERVAQRNQCRQLSQNKRQKVEARVGIEPTHKGFADLSLTTWVPRLSL